MASFASSATTCGARKHAWTKNVKYEQVPHSMEVMGHSYGYLWKRLGTFHVNLDCSSHLLLKG